jgi:hypothetical protein
MKKITCSGCCRPFSRRVADAGGQQGGVAVVESGNGIAKVGGTSATRLANNWRMRRSPPEQGSSPACRAAAAAFQSMVATEAIGEQKPYWSWTDEEWARLIGQDQPRFPPGRTCLPARQLHRLLPGRRLQPVPCQNSCAGPDLLL